MEARITFRSEIFLRGTNVMEIREKFEKMNLFSKEAETNFAQFIEVCSVDNEDNDEDVMEQWNNPATENFNTIYFLTGDVLQISRIYGAVSRKNQEKIIQALRSDASQFYLNGEVSEAQYNEDGTPDGIADLKLYCNETGRRTDFCEALESANVHVYWITFNEDCTKVCSNDDDGFFFPYSHLIKQQGEKPIPCEDISEVLEILEDLGINLKSGIESEEDLKEFVRKSNDKNIIVTPVEFL